MSVKRIEALTPAERAHLNQPMERWRMYAIAAVGMLGLLGAAAYYRADEKLEALLEADTAANVRAGVRHELIQDGFHVVDMDVVYYPEENAAITIANVRIDNGCYVDVGASVDVHIQQVFDTSNYTVAGLDGEFRSADEVLQAVSMAGLCD